MKAPVRYIFDRSFDEIEVKEEIIEEIVPTYSEDEFHAAQQIAYQEGVMEGRRLAREEIEAELLEAMGTWSQKLEAFMEHDHQNRKKLQQDAALLAHQIAEKICRQVLYHHAAEMIEDTFQEATSFMLQPGEIIIQVHPDLLEPVKTRIQAMIHKGEVEIFVDPDLDLGDCQLTWSGGGAEFRLNETLEKIDSYIKAYTEDHGHGQ